ncbi:MarR family transcriptional regulator [Variovorax dokdonensis]|uniref:MarR family transcriptional regulator n=1 Tax=Variovorax dokdonensis TaxID=344883 RepID=A0ABT7NDP2_9BURK|nr:MarR family transcriptional regulator [Variovorax dokdonensis]MDM0046063.1 MarR family transcriptional regulator [Variovorax dokdonensis]
MMQNPNSPALEDAGSPRSIESLVLFRMSKILSIGGSLVTRLCEGRFGIARREWAVLSILATQPQMPWPELARRMELDSPRLSRAVSALASKGLAIKSGTGRQLRVSLTDSGRALYAEIFPLASSINQAIVQDLDAESLQTLDRALCQMHERAGELSQAMDMPKAARRLGKRR